MKNSNDMSVSDMVQIVRDYQEQNKDLTARNKALTKKVEKLEWRLDQREHITRRDFEAMQPFIESVQAKIVKLFLEEVPIKQGLTHQEIQDLFGKHYPMISITNIPRRVRELVNDKKLWRCDDADGTARFFLTLNELPEGADTLAPAQGGEYA